MKKRIVIALGGNALGNTPEEEVANIKVAVNHILDLIKEGHEIVLTHGNGPQVGMINLAMQCAQKNLDAPIIPFAECGAMSQGYIGYHLQQVLTNELLKNNINRNCSTLITQVLVDENDEAFNNPTKPIGNFFTKEEAEKLEKSSGYTFKQDAGRGYRRVVASPKPLKILELNVIKELLNNGNIVITCGGGGVPVYKENNSYKGIDAVIDKDLSSSKLAIDLKADILLILTNIESVVTDYKKTTQKRIEKLNLKEAQKLMDLKEFAEGSMLPKVLACCEFISKGKNNEAFITSIDCIKEALKGEKGTLFKEENNEKEG